MSNEKINVDEKHFCQIDKLGPRKCRRVAKVTRTTNKGIEINLCKKCDESTINGKTIGEIVEAGTSAPAPGSLTEVCEECRIIFKVGTLTHCETRKSWLCIECLEKAVDAEFVPEVDPDFEVKEAAEDDDRLDAVIEEDGEAEAAERWERENRTSPDDLPLEEEDTAEDPTMNIDLGSRNGHSPFSNERAIEKAMDATSMNTFIMDIGTVLEARAKATEDDKDREIIEEIANLYQGFATVLAKKYRKTYEFRAYLKSLYLDLDELYPNG